MRYLLLTYITRPDGRIDEAMTVAQKLKSKDLTTVNVILDFEKLRVEKCMVGDVVPPKDWDRIVSYYYQFYPTVIERLFEENGHPVEIATEPETPSPDTRH